MKTLIISLVPVVAFAGSAFARGQTFSDATFDLFDNNVSNLDIVGVTVSNTATDITFSVETRGYEAWSKYLFFFDTGAATQTGTNGWNRPVNLNGQLIDHYVGSWVDQPSDNAQFWSFNGNWNLDYNFSNDQSQSSLKIVSWTFSLSSLGLGVGDKLLFDVGTSGGGDNDTTVDLLSRDTQATDWWTNPATAGEFRSYQIVPGPGSLALAGAAGAVLGLGRRRRDN